MTKINISIEQSQIRVQLKSKTSWLIADFYQDYSNMCREKLEKHKELKLKFALELNTIFIMIIISMDLLR